jgi:hypothetical protein
LHLVVGQDWRDAVDCASWSSMSGTARLRDTVIAVG